MGIGDFLAGIFGSKKVSLDSVTVTDLENEKIRLETEQEKLVKEVRKIEGRKKKLFEDGTKKSSLMEKRAVAVQIKQLDEESKDYARAQAVLSKQIMVIGKVLRIKRRETNRCRRFWQRWTGSRRRLRIPARRLALSVTARADYWPCTRGRLIHVSIRSA